MAGLFGLRRQQQQVHVGSGLKFAAAIATHGEQRPVGRHVRQLPELLQQVVGVTGQPVHQQPDALVGTEALDARGAHSFALLAQGGDVVGRQAGSSGFGGVPADTVSTS
ncbi:MAG: hypothetical protein HXM44_01415 [Lautropia mirabilis]|nr:hypothetical protein [Lautropia mirabilis]